MRFVIITGLSGAGKSNTLRNMEDMGFFCVDNLPPVLIPKFAEICRQNSKMENVALGVDMRGGELFHAIDEALQVLDENGIPYEILYMEADEETLVNRYKETRRMHPLSTNGRITDGIHREIEMLAGIKKNATKIIDTTDLRPKKLKEILRKEYGKGGAENTSITVVSFGFKRGIPADADIVLDVRFLPNPFYVSEIRPFSGRDQKVKDYVFSFPEASEFVNKTVEMIEYILPFYCKEAKSDMVVAVGCTGGMHRSVAVAESMYQRLQADGRRVILEHRDLEKEKMGIKYHPIE